MNPDQYTNIMTTLATLVAGQNGTNEHLRQLNGKVATHEATLNSLMIWKAKMEGVGIAFGWGWAVVISLLSGGAVLLANFLFKK